MESGDPNPPNVGVLAAVRDAIRSRHYSLRTERVYLHWVRQYVAFHGRRSPRELGHAEVTAFLTSLAMVRKVSASTQNQALAAILFLYREVLAVDLPWLTDVVRAKAPRRLPTVLSRSEVDAVLLRIDSIHGLMARLMYGVRRRPGGCEPPRPSRLNAPAVRAYFAALFTSATMYSFTA